MKPHSRRLHLFPLTLAPVALFLGGFGWLTYARVQFVRLRAPLISAVKAKDAARVRKLLDRGADPDARDRMDTGPGGLRGLFRAMLGRNPDAKSNKGQTALMLAASNQDATSVQLLLERGADVNARGEGNWTALMCAVGRRNTEIVKLLIARGAHVNIRSIYGMTPLIIAADAAGPISIFRLLLEKGADVNVKEEITGQTPLAWAASDGRNDMVRHLLERGADVNAREFQGKTVLRLAEDLKHVETVALLKQHGAKE